MVGVHYVPIYVDLVVESEGCRRKAELCVDRDTGVRSGGAWPFIECIGSCLWNVPSLL